MATDQVGAGVALRHRQSLEAKRVLACRKCSAPGVWRVPKNEQERAHYSNWPGVLADPGDPERPDGQSVGDTCPNCGASRTGLIKDLGEIWHRFFS